MTKRAKTSLEARLCLLMIGTLFAVLLGVGHIAIRSQRIAFSEQMQTRFDSVARSLSLGAGQIASGDNHALTSALESRVRTSEAGLEYIVIADQQGKTLFAASKSLASKASTHGAWWWHVVRMVVGKGRISPEDIYSTSVPITLAKGAVGTFRAGFRASSADEGLAAVEAKLVLSILAGFVVGIVLCLLLAKSVSKVLRSITHSARAVAAGNFSCSVPVTDGGELGELAQVFNHMIEMLSTSQERLMERANTDSLTGLYNHRFFQERLAEEMSRSARYGSSLSMLMIDIDYFKNYNDTHGHPSGDAALRDVAQILMNTIRETDTAVRYGGEEFAIVLPETVAHEAELTAERIRSAVAGYHFVNASGETVGLTVSVGVAEYPAHCSDRTSLISTADVALYHSKARGRNCVTVFDSKSPAVPKPDPCKLYVLLHAEDDKTLDALSDAIDAKLKLPIGHSHVVSQRATAIAKKLELSDGDCSSIQLAALLRDVGQIAVADSVLGKTSSLSKEEMAQVAAHPCLGHAIIQKAPHLSSMLPAVLHHHERYDGTGYPNGLIGEAIPIAARVIAVADAYQSMLTARPHRRRMSPGEARMELVEKSGTQFDPKVVQAFLEVLADEGPKKKAA